MTIDEDALVEEVTWRGGIHDRAHAIAAVAAALEAVGHQLDAPDRAFIECLDGEARTLLARRLPPIWAAVFAPVPNAAETEVPAGTVPGHGHSLATGRPGSRRPLAEAAPAPGQSDSVVTADNPHADSKLSSAREPAESGRLATARVGADYPIAQAKDERPRTIAVDRARIAATAIKNARADNLAVVHLNRAEP